MNRSRFHAVTLVAVLLGTTMPTAASARVPARAKRVLAYPKKLAKGLALPFTMDWSSIKKGRVRGHRPRPRPPRLVAGVRAAAQEAPPPRLQLPHGVDPRAVQEALLPPRSARSLHEAQVQA